MNTILYRVDDSALRTYARARVTKSNDDTSSSDGQEGCQLPGPTEDNDNTSSPNGQGFQLLPGDDNMSEWFLNHGCRWNQRAARCVAAGGNVKLFKALHGLTKWQYELRFGGTKNFLPGGQFW